MEISHSNALMPIQGINQLPTGLETRQQDVEQSNSRNPRGDKIVFVGYRPRYYENTYNPYGSNQQNRISTGEIVDIYI